MKIPGKYYLQSSEQWQFRTVAMKPVRAAAVQMQARLADIPYNIAQVGELAETALRRGARVVALPEFFTTQIVYDERLFSCALPQENPALSMLQLLARKYEAILGGSYLEFRDGDAFNTYVLLDTDGEVSRHDKDQPTMVENAFYIGGNDPGIAASSLGVCGMAVCWEMLRTRTVRRLAGNVDFLMTGSHWWSEPGWPYGRTLWNWLHRYNAALMARTPGAFARLIGAPNLQAAHCGVVTGELRLTRGRGVGTSSRMMGETQITDASGTILGRREAHEGPGIVEAEVLPRRQVGASAPDRFWVDDLPAAFRLIWWHQNRVGREIYRAAKAEGKLRPFRIVPEVSSGGTRRARNTRGNIGDP